LIWPVSRRKNMQSKTASRKSVAGPLSRSVREPGREHLTIFSSKKELTRHSRVWDCHAGKNYPADAVYIGCQVRSRRGGVIREGSIFGNGTNPLVSHRGALLIKREFRAYAIQKLNDPTFRAEAEKLRGRDLLCWCVQEGKRRAEFCHARVWLELINNSKAELKIAELSAEHNQPPRTDVA
jgi:Domain of unknown function (DUF4326)